MKLLGRDIAPLGMGCWPISGPMYADGVSVGYAGSDDDTALRTVHAALDAGIALFDTAAAYGAGHGERLLGRALRGRDAMIITKVGVGIDEQAKAVTGALTDPADVIAELEASLRRLGRDSVDIAMLHLNTLPVAEALPIFDALETAREAGKIRAYGWSTDFSTSIAALTGRPGVIGAEHGMNVFFDAPKIRAVLEANGWLGFARSPLAMGLLTGKFDASTRMPAEDVRGSGQDWMLWFTGDGRPVPQWLDQLAAVRELLQTGGRSLTQGAIAWLWATSGATIPLPGARTPEQITETAGALAQGPLPADVMAEIERLMPRNPDEAERER